MRCKLATIILHKMFLHCIYLFGYIDFQHKYLLVYRARTLHFYIDIHNKYGSPIIIEYIPCILPTFPHARNI